MPSGAGTAARRMRRVGCRHAALSSAAVGSHLRGVRPGSGEPLVRTSVNGVATPAGPVLGSRPRHRARPPARLIGTRSFRHSVLDVFTGTALHFERRQRRKSGGLPPPAQTANRALPAAARLRGGRGTSPAFHAASTSARTSCQARSRPSNSQTRRSTGSISSHERSGYDARPLRPRERTSVRSESERAICGRLLRFGMRRLGRVSSVFRESVVRFR